MDVRGLVLGAARAVLDDDRVLYLDPGTGTVVILDPETGDRLDLGMEVDGVWPLASVPGGRVLVQLRTHRPGGRDAYRYARLDPSSGDLLWFPALEGRDCGDRVSLVAVLDGTRLLVILDHRRIVKVSCDGSAPEVVFPRG